MNSARRGWSRSKAAGMLDNLTAVAKVPKTNNAWCHWLASVFLRP